MEGVARLEGGLLARNTVLNALGQAVPLGVAVLAVPFVVNGLGAERFGILALAWIVLGYFGLFDLGLGRAATKYVAEALGRDDVDAVPVLVGSALVVQGAFGLLGGLVLTLVAPVLVGRVLDIPPALAEEALRSFYLLGAAVPLVLISGTVRGVLEAAQRFDLVNAVSIPANSASYLLPLVGVLAGLGLPGIVALLLTARLASVVGYAAFCLRVFPTLRRRFAVSRDALRGLLGFGGWIMVSSVTTPILIYLERLLIASLITVGTLTYYAVPYEMVSRVALLPASFALTLFPAFSFLHANRPDRIGELASRPFRYLLVCATPVMAIFLAFAPDLLELWVGAEFARRGATPLRILAVSFLLNALAHIPLAAVQGLGRPDLKAKLDLIEVPLFLALAAWFIPLWGITGAAWAKLAITVVDLGGLVWLAARTAGWSARDILTPPLARTVAMTIAFLATVVLVAALTRSFILTSAIFAGAVIVYVTLFWTTATDERDRTLVKTLAERLRVRRAA
mgnify:CR=1 FL=1